MADDFRFNLWKSILKGDLDSIQNNLLMYTFVGVGCVAAPFLITKRYVKGKYYDATTDNIDICEKCIKKFMDIPLSTIKKLCVS